MTGRRGTQGVLLWALLSLLAISPTWAVSQHGREVAPDEMVQEVVDRLHPQVMHGYVTNVVKTIADDTYVLNTGDESFCYWFMERHYWPDHPEEAPGPRKIEFHDWLHEVSDLELLNTQTEAEIQRDIIGFFLREQIVEIAARALGAKSDRSHPIHFATTFFRPEFLRVAFFRYWRVTLDGLVYRWEPRADYLPVIIQDIIQTNADRSEADRVGDSSIAVLEMYLEQLLAERSPKFAAQYRDDHPGWAFEDAADRLAPATEIGPLVQQPDGAWRGPTPVAFDDPGHLSISISGAGNLLYQVPNPEELQFEVEDRGWLWLFDWRGIFVVGELSAGVQDIEWAGTEHSFYAEEYLARYLDCLLYSARAHADKVETLTEEMRALDATDTVGRADRERFREHSARLARRWLQVASTMKFQHHPDWNQLALNAEMEIEARFAALDPPLPSPELKVP